VNGFIFGIFDWGGKNYEFVRFFWNSYKETKKKREETKTTLETIVPHTWMKIFPISFSCVDQDFNQQEEKKWTSVSAKD